MTRFILVTGGCRSGKSRFALQLAESAGPKRTFLATCPVVDDEMRDRIERHRKERDKRDWTTVEEPVDLARAIDQTHDRDAVLIDCLTLWMSNLMFQAERCDATFTEDDAGRAAGELADACRRHPGTVVLVANEVGTGVVPENDLARRFRDFVGRCNQTIAAGADAVVLMTCGIPLYVKDKR